MSEKVLTEPEILCSNCGSLSPIGSKNCACGRRLQPSKALPVAVISVLVLLLVVSACVLSYSFGYGKAIEDIQQTIDELQSSVSSLTEAKNDLLEAGGALYETSKLYTSVLEQENAFSSVYEESQNGRALLEKYGIPYEERYVSALEANSFAAARAWSDWLKVAQPLDWSPCEVFDVNSYIKSKNWGPRA